MPRSSANILRQAGQDVSDVRDIGFNGTPDREIFEYAQSIDATIVTRDIGFASTLDYPLGTHAGIIVLRVPTQLSTNQLNSILLEAVEEFIQLDLIGSVVVVEPGRTRIRRPAG